MNTEMKTHNTIPNPGNPESSVNSEKVEPSENHERPNNPEPSENSKRPENSEKSGEKRSPESGNSTFHIPHSTLSFLGTGTSTGVPQIGCQCPTCTSADPRDRRLRASAIVSIHPEADTHEVNILIDCGPDFRQQILRAGSPALDALLITHSHYDHVGGIDDLRPYCNIHALRHGHTGPFPVYCTEDVAHDLRTRVPYSFAEHLYPGVPTYDIHIVEPYKEFYINGIRILPVTVMHARLPILGFRIYLPRAHDNDHETAHTHDIGYITDCKTLPQQSIDAMRGVDTLVINALRHTPHMSHITLDEALALIQDIAPGRAYLTHLSHDMGTHAATAATLPPNVHIAIDTLTTPI